MEITKLLAKMTVEEKVGQLRRNVGLMFPSARDCGGNEERQKGRLLI